MKKIINIFIIIIIGVVSSCTVTEEFVPETPVEGKSLLVGGILIENHGIGETFASKKSGVVVKITGKSMESADEETATYRLVTDKNGYFIKQNVPPGAYVIKGIEAYLAPNEKTMVRAYWDGPHMFYELTDREFDYAVREWPSPINQKIINLNILHLEVGIGSGRDAVYDTYESIGNEVLTLPGIRHSMQNPVDYYQEKYPDLAWW